MIDEAQLSAMIRDAETSINLRLEGAKKGHASATTTHVITSFELIEMCSEILNFRKKFGKYEGIRE